jgi:penicillin-binding protein 1A
MTLLFGFYFLHDIPSIEKIAEWNYFRESTVIYDKDGNEIYSIFKDGKRTYVWYDAISDSIKNAIISAEDRTFFENPGIDFRWLLRVTATYITGNYGRVWGASTISQQLIKNTLLTNERSIKRKVQEGYLSYRLNNNYTKEKILEMYLNAISFGYNANGIEQASRTFFWKSAKDVGPLWATILASLPNGPTKFSPYLHRDRLMGKLDVYPSGSSENAKTLLTSDDKKNYASLYTGFKNYIGWLEMTREWNYIELCGVKKENIKDSIFSPDKEWCLSLSFDEVLKFFSNITLEEEIKTENGLEKYTIEYTIGRKDFVASQMLEDGKIDGTTFLKIIYDWVDFEFKKYAENIKYPYFVMYIKEYLETKYGKDIDITSGLKVYTTIDPKLQDKAEELVKKQALINIKQYGARSAALVSMDNKTGKLLAMVGWPDYFDTENGGNNNMVTALRQPWSSFKPIVYALAISKNPIGPESPIGDTATDFAGYKPDNYDKQFYGVMMVKNALAYSRNIPAIKMLYLAWWEDDVVKFAKNLGLGTLKENAGYWAPLAIGAGEVRPIDMLQAYSTFANLWVKKDLYAIEKIEDSEGNIIEEHKKDEKENIVFSPESSYIVNSILSDNSARPESSFWRWALSIAGKTVAAKTGTSNKDVSSKGVKKILPRDLWTIGYTPDITTVVWAGNVNGKETGPKCDGLNCAAPIWKGFMDFALKDKWNTWWKKPTWVYSYNIVKSSGKLATEETPKEQVVSTIMAVKFDTYDSGLKEVQIDSLCNGPLSENTPAEAIKTIYVPWSKPIIDGYDPSWTSAFFEAINNPKWFTGSVSISWQQTTEPCERPSWPWNISITIRAIELPSTSIETSWIWDRKIATLRVLINDVLKKEFTYGTGANERFTETSTIDSINQWDIMKVELIDMYGFKYTEMKSYMGKSDQLTPSQEAPSNTNEEVINPEITLTNPKGWKLNLYEWDTFNLRFQVKVWTANREVLVTMDDKTIQTANAGEFFVIPIWSTWLANWLHTGKITLTDGNFKTVSKSFIINILKR